MKGSFLLSSVSFTSENEPFLELQQSDEFRRWNPVGFTGTITFDTSVRYCIGWRDIEQGVAHACPTNEVTESKHEQCRSCQLKTGFNPAFYHAKQVSEQQEKRNREPHSLYLAYFAPGVIKVGISYHKRGIARLLEQGARAAVILDTFPSALIARQYEAKIAALSDIRETIQASQKLGLLHKPYTHRQAENELVAEKVRVESSLLLSFDNALIIDCDSYYGNTKIPVDFTEAPAGVISGSFTTICGPFLFARNDINNSC